MGGRDGEDLARGRRGLRSRAPYDCRVGTCRTCESRLLFGEVDGAVTTLADGERRVLPCVSYPRSDLVVIEPSPG
ncbi:2Fe-2S iron-sulfur cluster-binding protein [Microbacterium marinilacus]|uniref:2Fe-2S iron-sulfur cluster-binding protein n=1 Tax=Microbacterium marinilacus TaxID=415209 RepID=UPI003CD097EA